MTRSLWLAHVVATFWLLLSSTPLRAHEPGLSMVDIEVGASEITARLTLARRDLETLSAIDSDRDGKASAEEFAAATVPLRQIMQPALSMRIDDLDQRGRIAGLELDASDAVQVHIVYPRPAGSNLRVEAEIVRQLPRGHRQFVTVRSGDGKRVAEHMLHAEQAGFAIELSGGSTPLVSRSFRQFLLLGIEHIVTGYDHVLFLLGLLVVGGRLLAVIGTITAFTIAHSLTLALATIYDLRLASHIVEPLIAASLIYVGIENLWRRDLHSRWRTTFAFGLIHGMGFASILRDLGVSGSDALWPLLAFNTGVELGQLAIALVVVPVLGILMRYPATFRRTSQVCSLFVCVAGAIWLLQRTNML